VNNCVCQKADKLLSVNSGVLKKTDITEIKTSVPEIGEIIEPQKIEEQMEVRPSLLKRLIRTYLLRIEKHPEIPVGEELEKLKQESETEFKDMIDKFKKEKSTSERLLAVYKQLLKVEQEGLETEQKAFFDKLPKDLEKEPIEEEKEEKPTMEKQKPKGSAYIYYKILVARDVVLNPKNNAIYKPGEEPPEEEENTGEPTTEPPEEGKVDETSKPKSGESINLGADTPINMDGSAEPKGDSGEPKSYTKPDEAGTKK